MGRLKRLASACLVGLALVGADSLAGTEGLGSGGFVSQAQARVVRHVAPGTVAGTARRTSRRTTRRVIRRSTIYVAALPRGCARVTIGGVALWHCGPTYYQHYGNRYVVVYID